MDLSSPARAAALAKDFSTAHSIRAVVAAEDEGAQAAAAIAESLGLAAHPLAAVQTAQDKSAARRALWHAGLPTPPFALCSADDDPESVAGRMPYPCVLKPNSLSASQGVMRADDERGFVDAWMRLKHLLRRPGLFPLGSPDSRRILVEGFLPGHEVAIEGLVTGGRFRTLAVFDKPDPLEGPTFEETIYVTPSRLPLRSQTAAIQAASAAAAAIGLRHGPVHAEVRVRGKSATLVEIAPRSIGGLCSRALIFAGGRSLEEILLLHALGQPSESLRLSPGASGVLMIPIPRIGTLEGVGGIDRARAVPGVEGVHMRLRPRCGAPRPGWRCALPRGRSGRRKQGRMLPVGGEIHGHDQPARGLQDPRPDGRQGPGRRGAALVHPGTRPGRLPP
jgi:biotin carboxylase